MSNNAEEYLENIFEKVSTLNRMEHQLIAPFCSPQNGKQKRTEETENRTLAEMACTILSDSNLPR